MAKNDEPEKVQDGESWDLGFKVRKYSRWMDQKGRIFIVIDHTVEWDLKRQETKSWETITLYNLHLTKNELPMPFERFTHYVAKGKLVRYLPKPAPKNPF
ncbi:hypothetical protein [Siphonobacter sp. SORGH_AS_0500]|uniref:hypothetical protein n=1 Tax=Siphonobacter sp. SORGH_AS_0500 TaxID=1864824 RepID=UPI0028674FE4|nr:hypothetical protein [Siphonobacter sp. SORGH_AS_0500]MDR6195199.1 hypothetical protein [Siphonobacter sp. SORGH_AS_0500]